MVIRESDLTAEPTDIQTLTPYLITPEYVESLKYIDGDTVLDELSGHQAIAFSGRSTTELERSMESLSGLLGILKTATERVGFSHLGNDAAGRIIGRLVIQDREDERGIFKINSLN